MMTWRVTTWHSRGTVSRLLGCSGLCWACLRKMRSRKQSSWQKMPNVILEESGSPAPFGTPYPGATAGAAVAANIANSMANAKKAVAEAKMRQALAEAVGRGELVEENGQLYETGKQPSAQRQTAPPAAQAPLAGVPMPSLDWRSGFPQGQNTADVAMSGLEEAANIRGMTVGELVRDQRRQAQLEKQ